jgi:two-component system chemotaxis response regulator CheY
MAATSDQAAAGAKAAGGGGDPPAGAPGDDGAGPVRKILVVDDSAMIRRLVMSVVQQLGYRALEAPDGASALALARQFHPDLVILDVKMPDMDGLEVLREIRHEAGLAKTPVLMLSTESDRDAITRALSCRASEYLVKPVGVTELKRRIARLLPGDDPSDITAAPTAARGPAVPPAPTSSTGPLRPANPRVAEPS